MTAYFGFNNGALDSVNVPVGNNNRFVPDPMNRSQTTNFTSGRSRYFPVYAFSVTMAAGAQASWQLNGYGVTADMDSAHCQLEYAAFEMILDGQTGPTPADVAALQNSAAEQMGIDPARVLTSLTMPGLGKFRILFNVTRDEADPNDMPPVLAVSLFFGDNIKFAAFVDAAVARALAPSSVNTVASGNEVEGSTISATPSSTPPTPSAPSSVPPTAEPDSPDFVPTDPNTTPSATPSDLTPVGNHDPSSNSPSLSPDITIVCLTAALVAMVVLVNGC